MLLMKRQFILVKAWICVLLYTPASAFGQEMTAERHQAVLENLLGTMQQTIQGGPYQSTDESLNQHVTPDWYADAKLGIFIHYGLFSVPGYSGVGCWYGNNMYDPGKSAYTFHREQFGPQDKFGYKDFAPYLTASGFDADEWISLFKQAGAKFVVPVSCFHDGFAMWDSKLTDWNAVKTGPKRDYDGLLAAAACRQGLKFGVAWHEFFRPDFFGPGRRPGTDIHPPDSGTPWSFYGPDKVTPEFVDDGLGRLVELVDGYHPDLVWFDLDTQFVQPAELRRFAAFYFNRAAQWKTDVAINDKHLDRFPPHSIVMDFERGKATTLQPDLWQTDTSVSWRDWSYMRNDSFKTVDELVHELVDIVSKNGVLLLDIGPRADGTIPPEPRALLSGIGAWLKVNGDAIYGTRPCWALGFGEGPHNSGGGGSSDQAVEYGAHDFRFTQRNKMIYAIAMDWPAVEDHFLIRDLNNRSVVASGGITGVKLLGSSEPLDWKLTSAGLWIERPSRRPCDEAFAFQITMAGLSVESIEAEPRNDHQLDLSVRVRNLDEKPASGVITFYNNNVGIGSETFALRGSETMTRSLVFDTRSLPGVARITAAIGDGKPFVAQAELLGPPDAAASRRFAGETMLAGGGLGKFDQLTLSLWTRTDALRDDWSALFNTAGWDIGAMHIQYVVAGNLEVSFKNAAGSGIDGYSTSKPGLARGWQLITVTYDAAKREAVMFINGQRDTEMNVEQATPVNLNAFTLGGWTNGGRRFVGRMADARLYHRVLTAAEIQELLNNNPPSNGLVAAWGGEGLDDSTGHGHALTEVK
jgi:alpha-L-fucosidase